VWSTCGSGFAIADASTTTSDNLFVLSGADSYALKVSLHHEDISNLLITLINPFLPQKNKALLQNVQATGGLNATVAWRFLSNSQTTVAQAAECGAGSLPTSGDFAAFAVSDCTGCDCLPQDLGVSGREFWKLEVTDTVVGHTGAIDEWCLVGLSRSRNPLAPPTSAPPATTTPPQALLETVRVCGGPYNAFFRDSLTAALNVTGLNAVEAVQVELNFTGPLFDLNAFVAAPEPQSYYLTLFDETVPNNAGQVEYHWTFNDFANSTVAFASACENLALGNGAHHSLSACNVRVVYPRLRVWD
ncbi:hypothetical protein DAPPUDRAFT_343298, partial [Daphnia pulex]